MIEHYCDEHKLTKFECVECLMTDNPWRYPAKGELPERDDFYVVTCGKSTVEICYWSAGLWHGKAWEESDVRAWRELPEPAPELEEEK